MEVNNLAAVAHELKAPLAVLRQLALSFDDLNTKNQKIRSDMVSVSERTLKQINDLVKIGRLEDGLFAMEPVAVRSVCDEVTKELDLLFRDRQRHLVTKYQNRSSLVTAKRDLLRSVIYNFLTNALRYSYPDSEARLLVKDAKDHVTILVRDFGPALPTKIWRSIKSGTLNQPTPISMRPGSSGLGLYISSQFSRHMNARLGAIRHRDGTSFYVSLPISKQASLFS